MISLDMTYGNEILAIASFPIPKRYTEFGNLYLEFININTTIFALRVTNFTLHNDTYSPPSRGV